LNKPDSAPTRERTIARLILNTKRRNRIDNLVEIARQIRWLEKDLGGLKEVSKRIGISLDQIRQFLSIEKMCADVKRLVEERKIDMINSIHYMRSFNSEDQKAVADSLVHGDITSIDVRVLAPLRKQNPTLPIGELIDRVRNSKNVRVYIAYFPVSKENPLEQIRHRVISEIGSENVLSVSKEKDLGRLELSRVGKGILLEKAKGRNTTLKQYLTSLIKGD